MKLNLRVESMDKIFLVTYLYYLQKLGAFFSLSHSASPILAVVIPPVLLLSSFLF